MDTIIILLAAATLGYHGWAMRFHFQSSQLDGLGKAIVPVNFLSGVVYAVMIVMIHQPIWPQVVGGALILASLALFRWAIVTTREAKLLAAFTDKPPHALVTSGPYAHVRHPFYSSYLLFWAGFGVATASIWAVVPFAALLAFYNYAAAGEEEKFSNTPMADDYAAFCKTRSRFIPRRISG